MRAQMKQLTPLWATLSLLGWSHQALAACGDGRWDSATEECDDANTSDGDGCAADCTIEEGYTCRNAPDLNTGSTLAGGQASPGGTDRVWQWSETLHGALNPAAVAGNCAPASWVSAPAYANWINRYGCGVTTPEATTTFYIATFELASAASAAHTVLNGTFWADNSVYDVYVNGTATGVAFGPIGYTGLGVDFGDWPSALYKPGVNQIAIEVYNDYGLTGNPDGLLVTLPNANGLGSVCEVSCGDGIAESWEECDDGNNVNGDGCSTSCLDETIDRDGDGASVGDGDCDDNDNTVYPGASDPAGDGVDQDCDGLDGDPCDVDADGFDAISCGGTDCDDTDAGVNPAATELPLDGIDQNCDGSDRDPLCVDEDYDGFYTSAYAPGGTDCGEEDCLDTDESVYPGAYDVPGDGIDQDCDGSDPVNCDVDNDGFDAISCGGTDCDDTDAGVNPAATELPLDGIDQNCDGSDRDPLCVDEDYDGFYTSAYAPGGTDCGEEDCLDTDASAYPGAIEILGDGVDQNCDGLDPAGAVCGDGRWDSRSEECDDANTSDGDGCAADCTIESGYTCKNAPDLNTGSNDNGDRALAGTHDRIWRWSETLDGVLHPAVVSGNCAAFAWEGAPSYADWINRYGCDVSTPPETTTFYVATFELSSVEVAAHTVLNGTFWADNSVFDVYVNGYSTGISFGPDGYSGTGVSFGDWPSSLYRAGENEIAIEVYNAAGDLFNPDGLLVTLENSHGVGSDCQVSCGDGVLETWEACDDGNTVSGDGCSEYCQEEAIDRDGDLVTVGGGDCDDTDPSIYPGATELPDDGIDQDCDGVDTVCDEDGDGFQAMSCGGYDCDDTDASINPAAVEIPGDGIDQNCDTSDLDPMCVDEDYDGYYTSTYAPLGTDCGEEDCVDTDETIYPGATEIPNDGIDQDCDGSDSVTTCEDADGDGHTAEACGGDDCDDTDDGVYPGATDIPGDGIDQDCDGSDAATGCDDADGDAYTDAACGGDDCDDTDPTIHPGAVEIVNDDIDQDCDGGDTTQWLQGGCSTTGTGGMSWFGLGLLAIVGLRRKGVRA